MGRMMRVLLAGILILLSGCEVVPMIAAIPSAIVEPIFGQFGSEERSLPISMRTSLVATQRALREMKLDIDVLETDEHGYNIAFANETLNGEIELRQQTEKLTTIEVQVRSKIRKSSIETAVLDLIEKKSKGVGRRSRFDFRGYHELREKPDLKAKKLGWYRPGALLEVSQVHNRPEWLKLKLPSGKHAYLRGSIQQHRKGK